MPVESWIIFATRREFRPAPCRSTSWLGRERPSESGQAEGVPPSSGRRLLEGALFEQLFQGKGVGFAVRPKLLQSGLVTVDERRDVGSRQRLGVGVHAVEELTVGHALQGASGVERREQCRPADPLKPRVAR
jgi:hypothetical protein